MSISGTLSDYPTETVNSLNSSVGDFDHSDEFNAHVDGMTNLQAIGRRVAELRVAAGLTQDRLAAEIGISRSTLAGVERGIDRAGIVSTVAIADYFKVPMDWLLGRSVPPGGPLTGEFTYRPDELVWIDFWRSLPAEERRSVVKLLNVNGTRSNNAA